MLITEESITSGVRYDDTPVIWEKSFIRNYLNNTLFNQVFSDSEKLKILDTINANSGLEGNDWEDPKGVDTIEKIYLVSRFEITSYNSPTRRATASDFAIANNAYIRPINTNNLTDNMYSAYYTRTNTLSELVIYNNHISYGGSASNSSFNLTFRGIRPAMQLKI